MQEIRKGFTDIGGIMEKSTKLMIAGIIVFFLIVSAIVWLAPMPAILRPHLLPEQYYEITVKQNQQIIEKLDIIMEKL